MRAMREVTKDIIHPFRILVPGKEGNLEPNPNLDKFASLIGSVPELWDARVRTGEVIMGDQTVPKNVAFFLSTYANPANMMFIVGDYEGVIGCIKIQDHFRAQGVIALKTRNAIKLNHKHNLLREVAKVVMLERGVLVIEAFVGAKNLLGQRICLRNNFKFRGIIPESLCYSDGSVVDAHWYELTRAAVRLE